MTPDLLAGCRVLVVEDEMLVAMTIEDMLDDLGCTAVVSAATVGQALAAIAAETFDLATLDCNLGGARSDAVADALAAKGVPFAFSTGYSDAGEDRHAARPVLRKPYRPADFAAVMATLRVNGMAN